MWFLLRMTFWLGLVLVLLSNVGSQSVPKSQIDATGALLAARDILTDIQHICERQREACAFGSQTSVTLGQRAQVGAKILYEFLSKQLGSYEHGPGQIGESVSLRSRIPQDTLRPSDLAPLWGAPQARGDPRLGRRE